MSVFFCVRTAAFVGKSQRRAGLGLETQFLDFENLKDIKGNLQVIHFLIEKIDEEKGTHSNFKRKIGKA